MYESPPSKILVIQRPLEAGGAPFVVAELIRDRKRVTSRERRAAAKQMKADHRRMSKRKRKEAAKYVRVKRSFAKPSAENSCSPRSRRLKQFLKLHAIDKSMEILREPLVNAGIVRKRDDVPPTCEETHSSSVQHAGGSVEDPREL